MVVHHDVFYTNQDRKSPKDKRNSQYIWCLILYKWSMYTQYCYRHKSRNQFIDFIKRIGTRYDSSIKTMFVVLDNASYIDQKRQ